MSIIQGITAHLRLKLPNFDASGWEPIMRDNLVIIDAALAEFLVNNQIIGVWQNSTHYSDGDVVVDAVDGSMWANSTAHTSAATGTFSEDRADNGYWGIYNSRFGQSEGLAVTPDQFGASIDEPTADTTNSVRAALAEALERGVPLQLDRIFYVSESLFCDMSAHDTLSIRGSGGLLCTADLNGDAVLRVSAVPEAIYDISDIDTTTRDFGGQSDLTTCTRLVIEDNELVSGRFVRIISEDPIEPNSSCNRGEVAYIAEVDGDDVYLSSVLLDSYGSSPRLALYAANKKVFIREITIANVWDDLVADGWKNINIRLQGLISPIVQIVTHKDISMSGIRVQGCVGAKISSCGFLRGLNDVATRGITGYGVDDRCSEFTQVLSGNGSDLRHLYTTNTTTSDVDNPWTYGTTRYSLVSDNQAAACSSTPFDTHDESQKCTFIGNRSHATYKGPDVAYGGIQLRGRAHKVTSHEHTGAGVGILIDTDNEAQVLGPPDKHTIDGVVYDGDNYAIMATSGLDDYYVWAHVANLEARTSHRFGPIRVDRGQVTVQNWKLINYSDQDNRYMLDLRGEAKLEGGDVICDFSTGYSLTPGTQDGIIVAYRNGDNVVKLDDVKVKAGLSIWDLVDYVGDSTPNTIECILEVDADKSPVSDEGIRDTDAASDIRRLIVVNKGKDGTTSYRETAMSGTNNEVGLRGCFAHAITRSFIVTASSVSINSIRPPVYQGQILAIVNSPSSTQVLHLLNTPGNRISIGADTDLSPGQGIMLVWVGSTWISASVSVSVDPGTGVTDHGALSGLDDDDHEQYHTDDRALAWLNGTNLHELGNVPTIGSAGKTLRVRSGTHAYEMPGWDLPDHNIWKVVPATHDADISGASLADIAVASVYPKAGSANNIALRLLAGADKGRFVEFVDHAWKVIGRIRESNGGLFEMRLLNAAGAAVKAYIGGTYQVFGGDDTEREGTNQVTVLGGLFADTIDGPSPDADFSAPILIGEVRLWDDGTKLRAKRGSDPSNSLDGSALW